MARRTALRRMAPRWLPATASEYQWGWRWRCQSAAAGDVGNDRRPGGRGGGLGGGVGPLPPFRLRPLRSCLSCQWRRRRSGRVPPGRRRGATPTARRWPQPRLSVAPFAPLASLAPQRRARERPACTAWTTTVRTTPAPAAPAPAASTWRRC